MEEVGTPLRGGGKGWKGTGTTRPKFKTFGELVGWCKDYHKLSFSQLSSILGISRVNIANIISKGQMPNLKWGLKIISFFEIPLDIVEQSLEECDEEDQLVKDK